MSEAISVPFNQWAQWWRTHPHAVSLLAGAFAGMSAEAMLFPLDSAKTRVQSRRGFWGSGGFRGIYRGFGTALGGSVPASAIFFTTYETVRIGVDRDASAAAPRYVATVWLASVLGELSAACIRVPVDMMKQRLQTGQKRGSPLRLQPSVLAASFQATAMRDVAQSSFQFPLYECLKLGAATWMSLEVNQLPTTTSAQFPLYECLKLGAATWMSLEVNQLPTTTSACCGSIAGLASAIVSTPFDLVKTRLNLRASDVTAVAGGTAGRRASWALIANEAREIYGAQGVRGFFKGAGLRGMWMGLGGFIFLGSFEFAKNKLIDRPTVQDVQMQLSQGAQLVHNGEHTATQRRSLTIDGLTGQPQLNNRRTLCKQQNLQLLSF
eukprot:CAMPEP_0172930860 /NCGR_PEP_ID=MMETSP1075-20121228/219203_1 /TAXON_ID=2916 /ORGANISM="Ceratium fusus, Strain PA161109" /LENGTH=379 /DNA_ID=CAMNT_0013792173 /DNA_START=109 /DNA_END=1250 /DNA_ORIENTATION=+